MDAVFWDGKRAPGVSDRIDLNEYNNLVELIERAIQQHGNRPAFTGFGKTLTFNTVDRLSTTFACYLQNHTKLQPGDRIAIQMPNLLQYPVVVYGAFKAGLVVVNINPLYTAREMKTQLVDSGARALICLNMVGHMVADIIQDTDIEHLVITEMADLLSWPKRTLINLAVKHIRKMVPDYSLPQAVSFNQAMKLGSNHQYQKPAPAKPDDLAVLQYTGGTTGVSKGAMLTHGNLVSNVLQTANNQSQTDDNGKPLANPNGFTATAPLPLYHIYAFTVHLMAFFKLGGHSVLIPNPRDIDAFMKILKPHKFDIFIGLNTLFSGLMNHPDFKRLDFSHLRLTVSGGTALQSAIAEQWQEITGCRISEGYGLSETSPVVCSNPADVYTQLGTVGIPAVGTALKVINEQGEELPLGERGELCIKGPQVMKGYWNRPNETANVLSDDGWFKTGDVGIIREDGYVSIVDRIKDMVLVSGFNVYPNEIEDVVSGHEKVQNCAAIGIPDEKTGEAIKLFVIPEDKTLSAKEVQEYCRLNLTGYKIPKQVEFRDELPMTPVGKVLRKELRSEEIKAQGTR
ncbi:AMP-binding protein [Endozoicomonas sp. GU-1]|uniref:AMP-binding protein n=1 Tax=Endozoicomonas sp. GU-1 TaxID=3009078 RepID=UPI0022B3427D|nr:AMP-binding protein [Endozoicomonas sp. GU-1]WBA80305.1 AMP-binding protein [Endozoicomonas sp. GU-1]WBA87876.1 AMP-binding protein [Endozoicomonas sp. GU-1]